MATKHPGSPIAAPVAPGNANRVQAPSDERSCHLSFELLRMADETPLASTPYRAHVDGAVVEGETDTHGRMRIDLVRPGDYLLEIGDTRMYVSAFLRSEPPRPLAVIPDGQAHA